MTKISNFEDLTCWKEARALTTRVYKLTNRGAFSQDYELRKQIRKASISVMSNIAEGFERDGNKEFINFLSIAKGSVGEMRAQLYVAKDQHYISESEFLKLYDLIVENGKVIGGLIMYLKRTKYKGKKFR